MTQLRIDGAVLSPQAFRFEDLRRHSLSRLVRKKASSILRLNQPMAPSPPVFH